MVMGLMVKYLNTDLKGGTGKIHKLAHFLKELVLIRMIDTLPGPILSPREIVFAAT